MKKNITLIIFITITIVIQSLSTFINIGGFPVSLSMIPIIVGGAIFGTGFGSLLGLIFGIIVSLTVLLGLDPTGAVMFSIHPFITIGICLIKGLAAGFVSSLLYKIIDNKKIAIIVSAISATITNTLLFLITLALFFDSSFSIIISTLLSINFLIELIVNTVISPACYYVVQKKIIRHI